MSLKKIFFLFLVPGALICAESGSYPVESIKLSGNGSFSDRTLKSVLKLKEPKFLSSSEFDRRIQKLDAIIIKNYYLSKGYLEASVKDSFALNENNRIDLYYFINEGKQTRLERVKIEGNSVLSEKRITKILGLEKNQPYNPIELNSNITMLEDEFANHGKLFLGINVFESIGDTFELFLQIDEGPDVYIDSVYINGLDGINPKYIVREILFKKGDLYRQDFIDETEKHILETGIFSFVKITPVRPDPDIPKVDLVVELRKFKPRELISEGGFYPFKYKEVAEELPSVGGTLEFRNRNIYQSLKRFSIKNSANVPITGDFKEVKYIKFRTEITVSDQWFAGFRLPTSLSGYYETYTDFDRTVDDLTPRIQKYGAQLSYLYRLDERSIIRTGLQWEKFVQPEIATIEDIEKRTINLDVRLDNTDNLLNPLNGRRLTINASSAGWILKGNREFVKIDFGASAYKNLFGRVVLAGRLKYGVIYGWDDEKYDDPQFDKFYLGGSTSLRGWDTFRFLEADGNPLGKSFRFMSNFELRIPLFWNLGTEIFLDGGNLADTFSELTKNQLMWNAGAGVYYQSPLGPIRFDYAIQLDEPRERLLVIGVLYAF